jgi:hypothetical protein
VTFVPSRSFVPFATFDPFVTFVDQLAAFTILSSLFFKSNVTR